MKMNRMIPLFLIVILSACSSVRVASDYDKSVDYTSFKTYAFLKNGIDKVEISDLDKKRILHAIEDQMTAKGLSKSETPDLMVNIFTKARQEVNVNQFYSGWGYGWGFGWNPWGFNNTYVTTNTEGTLFIDLIDAKKKELVWQGEGSGYLTKDPKKKDERVSEFVSKILSQFPPSKK
ncbi:MAG: hypothetical protein CFE23_03950 [Flavobacterium sp. BFFFF1]|uniref:DUF4136 domain-containing protein n=1 Tax=Flavobacterium sp. BFFFF1 TaxID=2015557 RepID=UPI000BCB0993|nr:DUF4136 domain-containing protein [Flavobacterium sp. BFFFF1]OYU81633.1 MAG: hypothetical protein CFE23_03950 [Flavobacterium sp. BFFFF1]